MLYIFDSLWVMPLDDEREGRGRGLTELFYITILAVAEIVRENCECFQVSYILYDDISVFIHILYHLLSLLYYFIILLLSHQKTLT
jgi:hypothetical protein